MLSGDGQPFVETQWRATPREDRGRGVVGSDVEHVRSGIDVDDEIHRPVGYHQVARGTEPRKLVGCHRGEAVLAVQRDELDCRRRWYQLREGANDELCGGWPMILSGLKTWLETGELLTTPGSLMYG